MSVSNLWNFQKSRKRHYSGKKKCHTQKAQVMADRKSAQIIATAFSHGTKYDFQPLKDTDCEFAEHLRILADAGYQGRSELHENSQTPFNKPKYHALTKREKQSNRSLVQKRIVIEHMFRKLKVFLF